MSGPSSYKVLRVAVIVDGESCEELHQTEPGDIVIGRAGETGLGVGPSTALEYGAAADGSKKVRNAALALIMFGLLLVLSAGGLFVRDVQQHITENAVLEAKPEAEDAGENTTDYSSTIALGVALLGVVPCVTGLTMLRGRRRRRKRVLRVYDGHARKKNYRQRAPVWLGLGLLMTLGGGGLFAYEVARHSQPSSSEEAAAESSGRGDMSVYKTGEREGSGGLGLALSLLGLVPLVAGVMGMQEVAPRPPKREPKGSEAPRNHTLFEWVGGEAAYYINVPAGARGKLALGKNKASIKALRKRFSQPDGNLRVKLGSQAKGKLLIGHTRIIFRTTKPARVTPLAVFPQGLTDPLTHLRMSGLDLASLGAVVMMALLMWTWFWNFADKTPGPPPERFVNVMGTASFYEDEEEPPPEEESEEDTLEQEDKDEKKEQDKEIEKKLVKPENVSQKAFEEARGVGVARVLGTYGGVGEGTVLDVIESTENNLGSLFAQGMTSTDEYRGGAIGDFVAGGGGIDATGTVASNEALATGDGPAEVGKTAKKERKVKGKAKSQTGDVFGDVDKKAVSATIRRRMPGLQACYEKALGVNPGLKGKMSYTITINPQGRVTKVDIEADTIDNSAVRTCTTAKIKGWRFFAEGAKDSSEVSFSVSFTGA